jgi:hypothetical protein
MSICINTSHPDFQKLLSETNLKEDVLKAKIATWRDTTGREEDFPTKTQVLTYALEFSISDAAVEKAIKELESYEKEPFSEKVTQMLQVLSSNWNRLSNATNVELKNLFKNPSLQKGNEFNELVKRLELVELKDNEGVNFEEKVRSFALTIQELDAIVGKIIDRLRDTEFKSLPVEESFKFIERYNSFLDQWEKLINGLSIEFVDSPVTTEIFRSLRGKITDAKNLLLAPKENSLVTKVTEILDPATERINREYFEDVKRLNNNIKEAEKKGNQTLINIYTNQLKRVEENYKKEALSSEVVRNLMKGELGDATAASSILEAEINSSDPITAATKKLLIDEANDIYRKIRDLNFSMQIELKPFFEKLGAERFKIFQFNKQFVQFVKNVASNGEEFFTVELMNEFTGAHVQDIIDFQNKIDQAEEKGDQEGLIKLRNEFAKWKQQYFHQEYKDEVYERYEVWEKTEGGRKAKELRDEIFAKINTLTSRVKRTRNFEKTRGISHYDLTPEEEVEYQGYLYDLIRLGSLTDEFGREKEGMDKDIAKAIQEYNKKTRDLYIWKERRGAFEAARKLYKEHLQSVKQIDDSVDVNALMEEWDRNNTRTVIKPEFYVKRKQILERMNRISSKIKEKADQKTVNEFSETWNKIFDQLTGYRDKDGQPIGTNLSEEKIKKVKDLLEDIEKTKANIEGLSGLTSTETEELKKLKALSKLNLLTPEQKLLKRQLEAKRKSLGLSEKEKEDFYAAVEELQDIQTKTPTDYYLAKLNQVTSHLGKDFDAVTATELLNSQELFELLQDDQFKEWFKKNHIKVKRYNPETKNKEDVWERLYIWNRIVPTDANYYESTTLEDGTILFGKPALKYYYRTIKDEKQELKELKELETLDTEQQARLDELIEKEKNNELESYRTEKIVGKTVNNKGEFLPKSIEELDKTKEDWDKYINYDYINLKENAEKPEGVRDEDDYAKYNIIEIYKKYYLGYQEGLPYSERNWYRLPSVRKTFIERLRSGELGVKSLWGHVLERLKLTDKTSQDEEEANVQKTEESVKITKADVFGLPITDIPMKYIGIMDEKNVSLNISKSITQFGLAAETKKNLITIEPFIKSLISYLKKSETDGLVKNLNLFKKSWNRVIDILGGVKYKFTVEKTIKEGAYRRLTNIRNLQDVYFRGIYKTGMFGERTAFDDFVENYILNPVLKMFGFSVLSADFQGATVNSVAGNMYLMLESVSAKNFNFSDYTKAMTEFHSKAMFDMSKDLRNKLGEKSFYGQLFDLYDPSQEFWHNIGDKYDLNGWMNVGNLMKNMFMNPRIFGEFQIAGTTLLAVLRNTKVKTKDGETISLIDAYELGENGLIKLKDGVEFSKKEFDNIQGIVRTVLRDTQGNYAALDKTVAERNAVGMILFFMKKYLVPLFMDQWKTRRFNIYNGYGSGASTEILNIIKYGGEGIIEALKNVKEWEAKDYVFAIPEAFYTGATSASRKQLFAAIKGLSFYATSLLGYILLHWSDDDEDRKKSKVTNSKWSYWKIQAVMILIKVKSEVEQNTVLGGRNEYIKLFKSPFMIAGKVSQINDLLDYIGYTLTGDEKAEYAEKGGWKKKMKKLYGTDNKALITFYKLLGYQGGTIIPTFGKKDKRAAAAKLERISKIVEGN